MRKCDIDRSARVWIYRPRTHKTAHHGHDREILIGPRAQSAIAPFLLGRDDEAYLFSPKEAEEERRRAQHAARKTPPRSGNRPGTNRAGFIRKDTRGRDYVDYKTVDELRRLMTPNGKIDSRKRLGLPANEQRMVAQARKRARDTPRPPHTSATR